MRARPLGPGELPTFIDLAWAHNRSDPLWVPPLRAILERELGGGSVFATYGRQELFLLDGPTGPIGRIGALVNPRLADAGGRPIGQVGYFEAPDDLEAARALLEPALEWLRAQGCREALGPMNGGAHRLHRFQVSGFDQAPYLFEPRNPPHHPRLFEALGWRPVKRWQDYELDRKQVEALRDLVAPGAARARRQGYTGEALDSVDPFATVARFQPLLDRVWEGHVGYAPIDATELAEVFAGAVALARPRDTGVVMDPSGRDVGVAFMFPDWADAVRAIDGDASKWGSWLSGPHPKRKVFHTVALTPEARRSGAPFMLLEGGLEQVLAEGYERLLCALTIEDFKLYERIARPIREHVLYGRSLDEA